MALMTWPESVSDVSSVYTCSSPSAQASRNLKRDDEPARCEDINVDQTSTDPQFRARWSSLFYFTRRGHIAVLVAGILFAILSGIVIPITSILFGRLFNYFASYGAAEISGAELVSHTSTYAIALVILGSCSWLLNGIFFMLWIIFGELQAMAAKDCLFQSLLYKEMEWYDLQKDGIRALIPRYQTQIRELQLAASQPLGFLVQNIFTAVAALGIALFSSWNLTLVIIASLPIVAVLLSVLSSRTQSGIESQVKALADASKLAVHAIASIETVKLFNGQNYEIWQYSQSISKAALSYFRAARSNALQIGIVRLAMRSMFLQGFWYGSTLLGPGGKSAGQVLTTFWACLMATQAIQDILPQMIVLEKGRLAGETLRLVVKELEEHAVLLSAVECRRPSQRLEGDIRFKSVSFAYPAQKERLAIQDLNLHFPAGEISFVVGRSGSGKSTLGNLLLRLYNPETGHILLDGEDLDQIDKTWLRENITLVQQNNVLFDASILQNVLYGALEHRNVSNDQISKATSFALLQDTLNDLEKGIETKVGAQGNSLSGGQKQRVALARAYLRNSPILILDESTSALDYISRSLIMDAIRIWREGMTTIIVTHDISQIFGDDYVYVMDDGRLEQEGTRKTLEQDFRGSFRRFIGSRKPSQEEKPSQAWDKLARDIISDTDSRSSNDSILPQDATDLNSPPNTFASPHLPQQESPDTHQRGSHLDIGIEPILLGDWIMSPSRGIELTELTGGGHIPAFPLSSSRPFLAAVPEPAQPSPFPPRSSDSNIQERKKWQRKRTGREEETASLYRIFKTVWPNLDGKYRIILLVGFLCALLYAVTVPMFSWVFAHLLDTFYQPQGRFQEALRWSLAILAVAVGDAITNFFMHYFLECSGQKWVDNLRIEALKRIMDQPRAWFDGETNSQSCLVEYLDRNPEEMRNLVGRFAAFVLVGISMMSIALTWSMIISWKLTVVGLTAVPFMYIVTRSFEHISGKWEGKCNDIAEEATAVFSQTFINIQMVRALTLEGHLRAKHSKFTENAFRIGVQRAILSGVFFGLADSAILLVTALIFHYGSVLAANDEYTISEILLVFTMLLFSFSNANAIMGFIPQIGSSRATATKLLRLANLPRFSHEHEGDMLVTNPLPVVFEDLNFSYPSRHQTLVLRDFNLYIPRGTCTAIVGASGSGKSTIVALLTRMYSSPASSFRVAGLPVEMFKTASLRDHIAIVQQNSTLFSTSVAANIAYGLPQHLASGTNIEAAARAAGIHEFIISLPCSYMTTIGDGGQGISGGQAQRIAIARALIRKPTILILDEATSSLDSESCRIIKETIGQLVKANLDLTVVIITHSKEMMRLADTIVVLEQGQVVETGGFSELTRRVGWLTKLIGAGGDSDKKSMRCRPQGPRSSRRKRDLGPDEKEKREKL